MAPPNILPIHGNEKTMNMNPMILTNIQSSPYFKVKLYELKTYHEVVDEIYFKVNHLEPWEKGSRKTAGQTGMCGGVRGVGAGGIVSSAYCLLYKLFTLRLTRKQLNGLLTHTDSCYIRALGFMYIRYTQPPGDFWEWYKPYLDDDEEIDVKAGGGHNMMIGEMLRTWLSKLEWYSTLFPRIPVPIQKSIEVNLREWEDEKRSLALETAQAHRAMSGQGKPTDEENNFGEAERHSKLRESPVRNYGGRRPTPPFDIAGEMEKDRKHASHKHGRHRSRSRDRKRSRSRDRDRRRSRDRDRSRERSRRSRSHERRRSRSRDRHDRDRRRRSRSRERRRSRSRDRHERRRSRSRDRRSRSRERRRHRSRSHDRHHRDRDRESSFERDLRREKERHRNKKHRDGD